MNKQALKIVGLGLLFLAFIALILLPLQRKRQVKPTRLVRGKIAIVLDDWGYSTKHLPIIAQIKQPLTCALLPGLKNSQSVMQALNSFGFEIILHLPMEPKEKYGLEKNTITVGMSSAQIENILRQDLSSIRLAKGVSNHMGSRVTEDLTTSTILMQQIKKHRLYFFDSFVTSRSVCPVVAKKINLKFAKRNIFLDNQNNFAYIKGQLLKLKALAAKQGLAIGIGHDRKNTLLVLKEMLPQLQAQGYEFIFLSQVVE